MEKQVTTSESAAISGRNGSVEALIETFVNEQDIRASSRKTYERNLRAFFCWLSERGQQLSDITRAELIQYKEEQLQRGLSPLTVCGYIVTLRKFYQWAAGRGLCIDITAGLKTPRRKQTFKKQHLQDEESAALLTYFQGLSLRNFAIVNLLLRTGLRTIEVQRADVGDIQRKGGRRVLMVQGKGHDSKDDFVILSDKTYTPIANYLATRPRAKAGEPLFVSSSHNNAGGRLTTRAISGMCKDGLKAIGIDSREYTAHSLRHTTAVTILKQGGSITDVQNVLRHASPATSQIYTESIKEELRLQDGAELLLDGAF